MVATVEFSERYKPDGKQVFVIIGDGTLEEKLLRAIAPKFNGAVCTLVLTSPPLPVGKKTGIAALEGLASTLDKGYKVDKAIYLVDKEHVASLNEIKEELKGYGFVIEGCEKLGEKSASLDLSRGHVRLKLYVAIGGDNKSIDEELAKLATNLYNKEVKPEDVKRGKIKIKGLISEATIDAIKRSLEGLASVLQSVEQQYR